MDIKDYQLFISEFYKERDWYNYGPFIRAIRDLEIGRDRPDEIEETPEAKLSNLIEELGDVLDNVFIIADKYEISLETIMVNHQAKLLSRYKK